MWFVESRNTSEEDLVVIVVEHDTTSHKEGDTTLGAVTRITITVLANEETDNSKCRISFFMARDVMVYENKPPSNEQPTEQTESES